MKLIKPNTNRYHFDNIYDKPLVTENFSIYQIGDLMCQNDTVIDEHIQLYDLELSFITEGTGIFFTNGVESAVKKGDIYISFKDERHKIISDNNDALRYYYFSLDFNKDTPYSKIYGKFTDNNSAFDNRILHMPYIYPNLTNILSELYNHSDFSEQMIETYIIQILVSLYRNEEAAVPPYYIYTADLKQGIVHNIINYIDENCMTISNLSEVTDKFNYNYSYAAKLFKNTIKMTMHTYLQNAKLNKAKYMLMENMSVTEVANALGYSSIHNFSRAYKNKFGVSPSHKQ